MGCCNVASKDRSLEFNHTKEKSLSIVREVEGEEEEEEEEKLLTLRASPGKTPTEVASPKSPPVRIHKKQFIKSYAGDLLSYYKIEKQLGGGTFGQVYLTKDKKTGTRRAVKIINKHRTKSSKKPKFLQETEILGCLDHPHIISLIEVIENLNSINIVTEHCSGGELFERIISYKTFTENSAAKLMFQILSAVMYCHESGVVHRDIKPENLIFASEDPNAPLKLIDFGVSRKLHKHEKLRGLAGTVLAT